MASKEALETVARIRKKHRKKSLSIRIQESELYDWKPGVRMTLLIIALGQRAEKEDYSNTWVQEDCPWTAEEMVGWCDFAQWRIAQRVGKSEDQVNEDIQQFERDGIFEIEEWTDTNNANHNRYRVVEAMIDDNQRPDHKRTTKRPSRYKVKRGPNKGSFSRANQPGRSEKQRQIMEEDGE